MYQYLGIRKTYGLRISLRRIRTVAIVFIFIFCAWRLSPQNSLSWMVNLLLTAAILILEYRRDRRTLNRSGAGARDILIMLGVNLLICLNVAISGGVTGPLKFLLLVPVLFYTEEFGIGIGAINILPLIGFWLASIQVYFKAPFNAGLDQWVFLLCAIITWLIMGTNHRISLRYEQKVGRLLIKDDLTGLYNRRFLKANILGAIRIKHPFALVIMDINYFKYYNDNWGHLQGDVLLIYVGRLLKETVPNTGMVVRYSGDEFVAFLPRAGQKEVDQFCDGVTQRLQQNHFPREECFPNGTISLAYGSVFYPDQVTHYEGLVAAADEMLYRNKKHR